MTFHITGLVKNHELVTFDKRYGTLKLIPCGHMVGEPFPRSLEGQIITFEVAQIEMVTEDGIKFEGRAKFVEYSRS